MPSNLSSGSSNYAVTFPSDLSPTNFSGSMDLGMLDMDGPGLMSYDGQDGPNGSSQPGGSRGGSGNASNDGSNDDDSGDGSDLMTFVEAL